MTRALSWPLGVALALAIGCTETESNDVPPASDVTFDVASDAGDDPEITEIIEGDTNGPPEDGGDLDAESDLARQ